MWRKTLHFALGWFIDGTMKIYFLFDKSPEHNAFGTIITHAHVSCQLEYDTTGLLFLFFHVSYPQLYVDYLGQSNVIDRGPKEVY